MQIDIGEVVIDAVQSGEGGVGEGGRKGFDEGEIGERERERGEMGRGKENRFAQSAFVGIQDLMD